MTLDIGEIAKRLSTFLRVCLHNRFTKRNHETACGDMDEIEIWRSAQQFISLHGPDAAIVAADLAEARSADGNRKGARVWRMVVKAINELSRTKPCGHEMLN